MGLNGRHGRLAARTLVTAGLVTLLISGPSGWDASPAWAHTRTQETTNIDSRLTHVPDLDGVRWTVHTGGLLVEVEHHGATPIVVHGYEDEPYLRVGPDGVERNRRSPATYLNGDRFARQTRRDIVGRTPAMPADAGADAPPEWVRISDEPRVRWHDHRTHWMAPSPPRFVQAGALSRTLMSLRMVGPVGRAGEDAGSFATWEIPVTTVDGHTDAVQGRLVWVDGPPVWPWLLGAVVLVGLPFAGWLWSRRPRGPRDAWLRAAALTVLLVAVANTIHLVDDLVAWPSDPLDELSGLLHTTIFLVGGVAGALWTLRVRWGRRFALGIASGAVLYHQGVVHLPMLQASRFPTVWPDGLVRLTIALALVQAVVVALALWLARRENQDVASPS